MSEILIEQSKDYYLTVREFASGSFEAVMKLVKPMSAEYTEAIVEGLPVTSVWDKPVVFTKDLTQAERDAKDARNHSRAVLRSKQSIRWLCKAMGADRLFTLTYRANQEDREQVRADFQEFLRLVRKRIPSWQYVAVLEKQDRGAYHIHCAVKGWQQIKYLRKCWYVALGGCGDETGADTPGQVDVTSPQKKWGGTGREWKTEKLAGYITKYIAKTFDSALSEKRRYWASRGIEKPEPRRMWVGGSNIFDAIKSCLGILYFDVGLEGVDFNWWISTRNDVLWIAGGAT